MVVQAKLHDAWGIEHRSDDAECGGVDVLVAHIKRGVVEDVKGVHAYLDGLALAELDGLGETGVDIEGPGAGKLAPLQHAQRAGAGIGEDLAGKVGSAGRSYTTMVGGIDGRRRYLDGAVAGHLEVHDIEQRGPPQGGVGGVVVRAGGAIQSAIARKYGERRARLPDPRGAENPSADYAVEPMVVRHMIAADG